MEARYGYKLELQLINGIGSATPQGSGNNQLLGILNNTQIPAANIISYTGATTATTMYSYLGQAVAAIGNNRLLPPECWMMRTNRVGWLATSEDTQNRPLIISDNNNATGEFDLATFEVHHNNAIPITLGTTANQDVIIACRPSDWLILESERRTNVYTEVISGVLSARIQMRRYASALLREPTSVAYITGSGMSRPASF
jgi:HK97 family phage major capsid protein